jgi:DUF1680 family protein
LDYEPEGTTMGRRREKHKKNPCFCPPSQREKIPSHEKLLKKLQKKIVNVNLFSPSQAKFVFFRNGQN